MGVVNPAVDPSNVVQALVYTLLGVFDTTRDIYQTLAAKEKRGYEESLRSKGYRPSRPLKYVDEEGFGSDEDFVLDKAAVTRQFEIGYQAVGAKFAEGDVISHIALQSQIITLQNVLLTTLLYSSTSLDPISHQLSNLNAASRAAGTSVVDILAAQLQRQQSVLPLTLRSSHSPIKLARSNSTRALPHPVTNTRINGALDSLVKDEEPSGVRNSSPVNTTAFEWRGRPKPERTDTDTTSMTGPTSYGTKSAPHDLYCLYAIDLQKHPSQELSASITSDPVPYCPHCKRTLHLSPGKRWEVCKDEDGYERRFQVSNRFVVKCHRSGADGQYTCVLCSRHCDIHSVCGDVKALIRHIWEDHSVGELKHEEDIMEVVELSINRRRDSGLGYSTSRSSRRSASVEPGWRGSKPAFEREGDMYEMRSQRRGA